MVTAIIHKDRYATALSNERHAWTADEPTVVGGQDTGPNPFDYLLAALASCIAITLRMYADRKEWPVHSIKVSVSMDTRKDNGQTETTFFKNIVIEGDIDDGQRARMLDIAAKCPVHRILTGQIAVADDFPL